MVYPYIAHRQYFRYPDGRFAPKGTGSTLSASERKTVSKYVKNVRRQSMNFNRRPGTRPHPATEFRRTGLTDLVRERSEVETAKKKLDESYEDAVDFVNQPLDVIERYKKLAVKAMGIDDYNSGEDLVNDKTWLMYEDWDQGVNSSFDLYLKDKGRTLKEYHEKVSDTESEYEAACRAAVDTLLGSYGSRRVSADPFDNRSVSEYLSAYVSRYDFYHTPDALKTKGFVFYG